MLFQFTVILRLLDAMLEDWGLPLTFTDKSGGISSNEGHMAMEVDANKNSVMGSTGHNGHLCKSNAVLALEVVEKVTSNKKAKSLLHLIQLNMYAFSFQSSSLYFLYSEFNCFHNLLLPLYSEVIIYDLNFVSLILN